MFSHPKATNAFLGMLNPQAMLFESNVNKQPFNGHCPTRRLCFLVSLSLRPYHSFILIFGDIVTTEDVGVRRSKAYFCVGQGQADKSNKRGSDIKNYTCKTQQPQMIAHIQDPTNMKRIWPSCLPQVVCTENISSFVTTG